jgi:hypothetical protein
MLKLILMLPLRKALLQLKTEIFFLKDTISVLCTAAVLLVNVVVVAGTVDSGAAPDEVLVIVVGKTYCSMNF